MSDLTDLTLVESAALLRQGKVSSRELTMACLDRINAIDADVHAFLTLTTEEALFRANRADFLLSQHRQDSSTSLPPLLGLPIAVKDVLSLSGVRCTCGSKILENFIPPFTATSVGRLIEDGVVILGKTNTDEFAMGSSTENSAFGPTRNPWNLETVPGGSSGGSAAAVASGMALGALGTDTGGSIRQPAAFCGLTGLKTTYGRISRYGLIAYGSSLDTVGTLTRTAADSALLFNTMAGHDPLDSTTVQLPEPKIELHDSPDLKGYRIGIPEEYFIKGIQPEVEKAVRDAILTLD